MSKALASSVLQAERMTPGAHKQIFIIAIANYKA